MASSNLRRTDIPGNGQGFENLSEGSSSDFTVTAIEQQPIPARCDQYPFDGQTAYRGVIQYTEQAELGGGRDIELEFEFRDQSRLFILDSDVDIPSVDAVINRLNALAANDMTIYRSLTVHRHRLWMFLRGADNVIELTLISKQGEELSLEELDSTARNKIEQHPIESATVVFNYEGEEVLTRYTEGALSIHTDTPQARDYIIQLFERDVLEPEE